LAFLSLSLFTLWDRARLELISHPSPLRPLILVAPPVLILWGLTCVAELNRTPFDFAEGESELVSGFNVEYGSVKFATIFMAEYAMIYFLSVLTACLFLTTGKAGGGAVVWGVVVRGGVV